MSWLLNCGNWLAVRARPARSVRRCRLVLEQLEDRVTPSFMVADFQGVGVWRYDDTGPGWQQLRSNDASRLAVDSYGDVVADFKGAGVWLYRSSSGWQQLTPYDANQVAIASGMVVADFRGWGVGLYNPFSGGWERLTPYDTVSVAMDAYGDVVGTFQGSGVWLYVSLYASWRQITPFDASQVAIGTIAIGAPTVVADFGGWGVGVFHTGTGWQQITPYETSSLAVDAYGDVVGTFQGSGVWLYTAGLFFSSWQQITPYNPRQIGMSGIGKVFGDWQSWGVGEYGNGTGWQRLTPYEPTVLGGEGSAGNVFSPNFFTHVVYQGTFDGRVHDAGPGCPGDATLDNGQLTIVIDYNSEDVFDRSGTVTVEVAGLLQNPSADFRESGGGNGICDSYAGDYSSGLLTFTDGVPNQIDISGGETGETLHLTISWGSDSGTWWFQGTGDQSPDSGVGQLIFS